MNPGDMTAEEFAAWLREPRLIGCCVAYPWPTPRDPCRVHDDCRARKP